MNKKKYIILGIILVLILGIGSTFAWYVWQSSDDEVKTISATLGVARVIYNEGSNISADIFPVATKEEGVIKEVTVKAMDSSSYNLTFNLYLDIIEMDDIFKHESFRYAIYKDGTKIKEGNFTEEFKECTVNNTTHLVLVEGQNITTATSTYTLYLWIDGVNYTNPTEMQRKSIKLKLHASGENAILYKPELPTLVETISNLYNDAEKTTITNNGIVYYRTAIYDNDEDDTTSGGLMNDRLGTMSVGADAGNIRYYGASPNNYIDIGDTEINSEGKEVPTLYRIIGVFKDVELEDGTTKDLVKVIRNDSIGEYSWDTSASTINGGNGINEWSQADLMKLLNPEHDNNIDLNSTGSSITVNNSLYWNSESGICYSGRSNATTPCDFKAKKEGLSTEAQEKIVSVVWNLGGANGALFSNQAYQNERQGNVVIPGTTCSGTYCNDTVTRKTEWPVKVALMYPSDYGYATDFNQCSSNLSYYDNSGCYDNDWLYLSDTYQWFLFSSPTAARNVFYVERYSGYMSGNYAHNSYGVRPVFYIDSELTIESGDGSSVNPYRLS